MDSRESVPFFETHGGYALLAIDTCHAEMAFPFQTLIKNRY